MPQPLAAQAQPCAAFPCASARPGAPQIHPLRTQAVEPRRACNHLSVLVRRARFSGSFCGHVHLDVFGRSRLVSDARARYTYTFTSVETVASPSNEQPSARRRVLQSCASPGRPNAKSSSWCVASCASNCEQGLARRRRSHMLSTAREGKETMFLHP